MRTYFFRTHLILLAITVLNAASEYWLAFGLNNTIETLTEASMLLSGLVTFFLYVRLTGWRRIYLGIYPFVLVVTILGALIKGLFWALFITIMLFPFFPGRKDYSSGSFIIYEDFHGIMGPCCWYDVKQSKWLIFEKDLGDVKTEGPINFTDFKLQEGHDSLKMEFMNNYEDSLMVVKLPLR